MSNFNVQYLFSELEVDIFLENGDATHMKKMGKPQFYFFLLTSRNSKLNLL